jgi:hypothetical protein
MSYMYEIGGHYTLWGVGRHGWHSLVLVDKVWKSGGLDVLDNSRLPNGRQCGAHKKVDGPWQCGSYINLFIFKIQENSNRVPNLLFFEIKFDIAKYIIYDKIGSWNELLLCIVSTSPIVTTIHDTYCLLLLTRWGCLPNSFPHFYFFIFFCFAVSHFDQIITKERKWKEKWKLRICTQ